jgi:pimeloyl-ACP methyl ester carboxylesterase
MLHGFDSSLLEFRRLYPLLAESQAAPQTESQGEQPARREVWLVDLLGFGFSDRPRNLPYSPEAIKAHLLAFWQRKINRPMTLIGASMGGAAAIDFATSHSEAVAQLILIDSAGYQNGPILGKYLFSPLDQWAVEFLRKPGVRRRISCNAYADPDRLVTPDAECCAALHLLMPRWDEALKAFTKSGGYPKLRDRLPKVAAPTLVLWGQQDRILGTRDAIPLAQAIPNSTLHWINNSGHVPHLEQPKAVAEAILSVQS